MANPTKQPSTAKLLLELNKIKPSASQDELNALFKEYLNPKDPSIHALVIRSANEVTKAAQEKRTIAGLENQLNGAIIGLELVKKNFARTLVDQSMVDAQINYLKQFRDNFNITAMLEDIAKTYPELAEQAKDPEVLKDFLSLGQLFGRKQQMSPTTCYLLLNVRIGNPKLFRNTLTTLKEVYKNNQDLLKKGIIPDIYAEYNTKARESIKDLLNNLYMLDMLGVERSNRQELITYLFAALERTVPTDLQFRKELMLVPLNPNPTRNDSTYKEISKMEDSKKAADKKIAALNEELKADPSPERVKAIKAEIKLQEKLRGYVFSGTTGIYHLIQWKRVDPKLEKWEHTIGFQSGAGMKKESLISLDLSFLGELKPEARRQVFEFMDLCDVIPGEPGYWIDDFLMSEAIPEHIQEKLNGMAIAEDKKLPLLKAVIDFNYRSNLAYFVNLSTFGG